MKFRGEPGRQSSNVDPQGVLRCGGPAEELLGERFRRGWVLDASLNRVSKYNRDGELLYHWGAYAQAGTMGRDTWSGGLSLPHQLDVDENGTLYIAS
jgi:hypothetical protein